MQEYRLGEALRELRKKRGLSQARLAARAQVTTRTLRYWENDQQKPRDVELESVLTALEATPEERGRIYALLTDRRSVRLTQTTAAGSAVPTSLLGSLPGIGDLLRAMRLRRQWTQEQLATEMRVSRVTIVRWESTRNLPCDEDIERMAPLLHASPQETAALKSGRLSPSSWPPQLTLEECHDQYERLMLVRKGVAGTVPLMDLPILALKRQIRFLLDQSPEALKLLAKVEIQHSWWLHMQGRPTEACAGNWRALNLVRGKFPPEAFWLQALNLLSAHAAGGAQGPENAIRLLYPWLPLLPTALHPVLLCDIALYAGQAQHHEEAAYFLERAQQMLPDRSGNGPGEHWHHRHFRLTRARVLLSGGRPVEALNCFPPLTPAGDGRIHELTLWAEAYLAAGETGMAARSIEEAQALLAGMPLPHRQYKLTQLAQRL